MSLHCFSRSDNWKKWLNCLQGVSCYPVFKHIRTTDENGWTHIRLWVNLYCLSRLETFTRMTEHVSRMWVASQVFEHLGWLTRMTEYAPSEWVALQQLYRFKPLTRMAKHIQQVSCSPVLGQIRTSDKNGLYFTQNVIYFHSLILV